MSSEGKMPESKIYRTLRFPEGYLVYRHCFDANKAGLIGPALDHKVAVFVTRDTAQDYCDYRNLLMDQSGSDALPQPS